LQENPVGRIPVVDFPEGKRHRDCEDTGAAENGDPASGMTGPACTSDNLPASENGSAKAKLKLYDKGR